MFKTYFIIRQQKIKFKPECQAWSCYYVIGCFVAFLGVFFILNKAKIWRNYLDCLNPNFSVWKTVNSEVTGKKATKYNKYDICIPMYQIAIHAFRVDWLSTQVLVDDQ